MPRRWLVTLDTYANATYGWPISSAVIAGSCVQCGQPARPGMAPADARAYVAAGLCHRCRVAAPPATILPFPLDGSSSAR
jgi:hypothetical protein